MYCPNCGLANEEAAKFCANCGTTLTVGAVAHPPPNPTPVPYQQPSPYQPPVPAGNSMAKNIGLGCLIAIFIFFFIGLSCTRACFGHRRSYLVHHF
jgi:uncharacterized membrane protein YvbJ